MAISPKPEPIIEKIEFTPAQQEDIKIILEGKPTKESIEKLERRVVDIEKYLKYKTPIFGENRARVIKEKYSIGFCHMCSEFPSIKVTYKLPDVSLIEYYCDKHLDWIER